MQATVTVISTEGIQVRVRRSCRNERLWVTRESSYVASQLRVGDKIECHRQPNNPYPVFDPIVISPNW